MPTPSSLASTPARRLSALALAVLVTAIASPAYAAAGVTPSDATPVQREEAQSHFAKARDLYTARKYDEAAVEFEKSYAVVASPNALFFLARCDRERGKLVAAYAELGRTAAEAREHASEDPRYAKTAQAASDERDAIAAQLGFVTVNVTGGSAETTVTVAGAKFPRAALGEPLPLVPGGTEVVVETPGKEPLRQTVSISAGERKSVTIDAGPAAAAPAAAPPPTPAPHALSSEAAGSGRSGARTLSYVSAGVAVAGLATFAVAGTLSNSAYSDLQTQCHGPCPAGKLDELNRGKTEQTIANVGLVVGIAGAAAAVVLFVVSLPPKSDRGATASVLVGPTWLGLGGVF